MLVFESAEDLLSASGSELGVSDWLLIDQERINRFADATGDHQWIHTDVSRAESGPFGATIAHGYLTLSLIPALASQNYRISGARMGINYGLNKVRFITPVRVGSRVRGRSELLSAETLEGGAAQVVWRTTIEVEGADRPACVAESVSRHHF
ncbi:MULTISPECIES: MaoC family dehydratase [unclassified Streptomyces]|uniref:MaoC family dehydratase n=1 Tax=unclassified Streptomyces TaxID=2593676 RepID=UPI00110FD967|nr:MaoC family dehydratase [Streptomyces sp. DASNCL29]TMU98156.1 MaoC family dehydratase [Streptomyces sp. DASNCL29]